jgi:hypothetical protein
MTEKRGTDFENAEIVAVDMTDWPQLTFTCPECGSHKLLKCLGGQVVYARVTEILYKKEEWGEEEEDVEAECDVEDAYVEVQSRPDGTELWDFGVDDASDHSSWFRCAECAYELAFEDGTPVETDTELAQCLIRFSKKSREAAIDAGAVGKE